MGQVLRGGVICISLIFKEGMQLKNETFLFDIKKKKTKNRRGKQGVNESHRAKICLLLEFLAKMHVFCQRHQR